MPEPQTFKNHGRIVPMYHIGVFFALAANFLWAGYRLTHGVTADAIVGLILGVALLLMFFSVRFQILTVQDRVIRLEMRLRLAQSLPADLRPAIDRLTVRQLVALRFASDAELPELVRDVLSGKLSSQKEIKLRVKSWQPDYLRA
jgi:hypothetical protein